MTPVPAALARRFRLPHLRRREALPLGLLLLALASVFAFGNDRSQFYRHGHHDFVTGHTLALTANLSAEHGFLLFNRQKQNRRGEPENVSPYSRFPIGNYVLVKLAMLPAGDGIPRQILAGRLLMLAFFAAAAVFAYLALARLLGDRRIALAATLLAFSPYYLLHYNDMVSAEASTNLFGVMLVFHGMVLLEQEGRFRRLLPRIAIAILLGWHVLGLIAPFVLLALGRELLAARADGAGARPKVERRLRPRAILACGAFSALCAALVLGFNLGNEYRALGGEGALAGLPTVQSFLRRSGAEAEEAYASALVWTTYLRGQFGGIGGMAIPFALADRLGLDLAQPYHSAWPPPASAPWFAAAGAAVAAFCLAGLRRLPHRTPFAALLLAGWVWALLFRGQTALHEFEAMFYLGYPLVLYALALLGLRRLIGPRAAALALPAIAFAALGVFVLSAHAMAGVGHGAEAAQRQREVASDVEAIRRIVPGRSVVSQPVDKEEELWTVAARNYYLTGIYVQIDLIGSERNWERAAARFDYVIAPIRLGGSLTPGNRRLHLYPFAALPAAYARIAAREPALRAEYDIRVEDRTLTLLREPCDRDHAHAGFFAETVPPGAPARGERREFAFGQHAVRFDGKCVARLELPDGPIAGLRVGQIGGGDLPPVWEASLPVEDASFPRYASTWRETVTAEEPTARGPFGVYRSGRTLTWVREDCAPEDAEDRFFVHVHDAGSGRENLDFWFHDRGVLYGGVCMASVALPDGDLRFARTGQYDATGHLWEVEFALDEAWLARFASFAAREPAARGPFGVHLEGRTLTWVRGDCAAEDAEDRFFVHVHAADGGGRENLDFWFRERGERYGDRCMASAALPDYEVRSVRTGQYDATGHLWDEEFALDAASWLARFASFAEREPALRAGGFGLHLGGRALTFVRGECGAEDIEARFFVHAYAADGGGRENLDFWFRERGLRHGDRCMASVELPEYAIDRVVTGQYDASGHLWEAELPLGGAPR